MVGIEAALAQSRPRMHAEQFDAFAKQALIAAYHGFLHLRLLRCLVEVHHRQQLYSGYT